MYVYSILRVSFLIPARARDEPMCREYRPRPLVHFPYNNGQMDDTINIRVCVTPNIVGIFLISVVLGRDNANHIVCDTQCYGYYF